MTAIQPKVEYMQYNASLADLIILAILLLSLSLLSMVYDDQHNRLIVHIIMT